MAESIDDVRIPRALAFRLMDTILDQDPYVKQKPVALELAYLIPQTPLRSVDRRHKAVYIFAGLRTMG